jgi:hypothetical protein
MIRYDFKRAKQNFEKFSVSNIQNQYFSCRRGVGQGDLMFPFLFDIVSEAFYKILFNASQKGYLKGVQIARNDLHILNLYFIDDTLLFFKASESNI